MQIVFPAARRMGNPSHQVKEATEAGGTCRTSQYLLYKSWSAESRIARTSTVRTWRTVCSRIVWRRCGVGWQRLLTKESQANWLSGPRMQRRSRGFQPVWDDGHQNGSSLTGPCLPPAAPHSLPTFMFSSLRTACLIILQRLSGAVWAPSIPHGICQRTLLSPETHLVLILRACIQPYRKAVTFGAYLWSCHALELDKTARYSFICYAMVRLHAVLVLFSGRRVILSDNSRKHLLRLSKIQVGSRPIIDHEAAQYHMSSGTRNSE